MRQNLGSYPASAALNPWRPALTPFLRSKERLPIPPNPAQLLTATLPDDAPSRRPSSPTKPPATQSPATDATALLRREEQDPPTPCAAAAYGHPSRRFPQAGGPLPRRTEHASLCVLPLHRPELTGLTGPKRQRRRHRPTSLSSSRSREK